MRSKSSIVTSTPASRAISGTWRSAFVEPPIAAWTTIAFSNASRVRIFRGVMSSASRRMTCFPAARAYRRSFVSGMGTTAEPGRARPSASDSTWPVEALPMNWHAPHVGHAPSWASASSSSASSPRLTAAPISHSWLEVTYSGAFSCVPPGTWMAGRSQRAIAR